LPHPVDLEVPPLITYAALAKLLADANKAQESLEDDSETMQTELQEATENYSRALETVSTIEKSVSDSASAIMQNLK
jgi:predicted GTPase